MKFIISKFLYIIYGKMKELRPDDRVLQALRVLFEELKTKHNLSEEAILSKIKGEKAVPASIFTNTELRPLEILCKYLKEELNLDYKEISRLLNRDYRTVWTTYSNASKKLKARLIVPPTKYVLPVNIFQDRKLSVLEAVVAYLKDQFSLKLVEISSVLNRDQRNVWSIYHKAKKKWKKY